MTDEEVIRRVQQGERELFELIFERHYARMDRYVRHLGVPAGEVDDMVAETFARAFARADRFDPASGTRYLSYLYAIARNRATDRLRERGRTSAVSSLEDLDGSLAAVVEADDPVAEVLRREQVAQIREALARLGPGDREIITLSYDRELSCREIMTVMGKPSITAVTTHLYKAVKRLRAIVLAAEGRADGVPAAGHHERSDGYPPERSEGRVPRSPAPGSPASPLPGALAPEGGAPSACGDVR